MNRSRLGFGLTAAALAVLVVGVGSTAASNPTLVIATQSLHRTLVLGDVAAGNAIGVDYQKGNHSYLRWSEDGGQSFSADWPLRSGNRSTSPRLASCGDWMWASSIARTSASGATRVIIDYLDVTDPESTAGHFRIPDGFLADVACHGDVLAVAYSVSPVLMFAVMDGQCTDPCTPAYTTMISQYGDEPSQVAAVSDGFVVTWPDGSIVSGLRVQHFTVTGSGGSIVVTPDPVVTLMPGKQILRPVIAGDGSRVVVAYANNGQTHMRISDNLGQTFGPRIIVSRVPISCCTGSRPTSVDARAGGILVEVGNGAGDPPAISMVGKFTSNDGGLWRTTTTHEGGTQIGVLLSGSVAEAWDSHHYASSIYGNVPQEIHFRRSSLP